MSPSTDRASIVSRPEPLAFDVVRDLARRHLTGVVAAGKPGRVNRRLVRALGEHGLLARVFPSAGAASARGTVSAADLCLLREALAMECPEAETALALQGLGAYPILQSGSAELAGRWIPAVRQGDAVAAFALTEPGAGSDAARLALSADAAPGGFYLSGEKCWISNAPDADVYTVFARTTPGAGARGITAFVVPGDAPGLSGQPLEMLAPHPIGRLTFDGVFVPRSAVLGEPDRGFKVAMRTLDLFRPSVGAFAVGLARSALDEAVRHTRARPAYGATLADLQAVAHKLADMAVAVRPPTSWSATPRRPTTPVPATLRCGRRWPNCSPPRWRNGWSTTPCSSMAPRRWNGAIPSSICTGMCGRPGSTKEPPRSSATSSPGHCSAISAADPRSARLGEDPRQ